MIPMHTWLPDSYPRAHFAASVFLSVYTTKAAVYLLARAQPSTYLIAFMGAIMAVYGVSFAVVQTNMRKLLSYHIVSQVGYMVAGVGLALNLGIVWGLGDHGHDLNLRAAWLHMLGDAASSAGIIAGAIAIRYTGWQQIDPALSILIGLGIVISAWGIIKETLNILLEGLPKGLKLANVINELCHVPGVIDVHDLHIWSLGSEAHALSCHVLIEDMPPSASESILRKINGVLCDQFEIHHTTIQFEHIRCALADTSCTVVKQHQH